MTSSSERRIKPGFEQTVPRTAEEFAERWRESVGRKQLLADIDLYNFEHPSGGADMDNFALARQAEKSQHQRRRSPYTLSYWGKVKICMWRELRKLRNDPSIMGVMFLNNLFEALILASVFYDIPATTSSFFHRGAVIFIMVLVNGFGSMTEIMSLYAKRKIVEKHNRYALYHPSAESLASMIIDLPNKMMTSLAMNITLYFMTNLRRETGPFFFYLLISFTMALAVSAKDKLVKRCR